jgi:hypothetical protein
MLGEKRMFNKGDFVKDTLKNGVHVGKVTGNSGNGVYVFDARTGQNGFYMQPQPATEAEYDIQIEQRLHPQKTTATVASQSVKQVFAITKANTFRWTCLECGAKYNGRVCPRCDGEDRILNSDKDHDPSYVGGAHTEQYAPGE